MTILNVNTRVLHIGNTAAIPKTLRDNLRDHGIKSDIMTFYPDVLDQGTDFAYPYSKYIRYNLPLYGALRMYHMLRKAPDYDILHFHAFGGITFYMDFPVWKLLKKKLVLHYHGTELRRFGKESPFAKYADKQYVSTPDLLPLAPGATWLPSPTPTQEFEYIGAETKDKNEPITIINAVASEAHGTAHKGLSIIRSAMKNVIDQGYQVDYRGLIGLPYAEALRQYQQADIVIGQTHIGWYGKLEQECMAFGKPVITYIDPDIEATLSLIGMDPVPVGHIKQDDVPSLERRIINLIENPDERARLGAAGRRHVEQWHDSETIMHTVESDYAAIMEA